MPSENEKDDSSLLLILLLGFGAALWFLGRKKNIGFDSYDVETAIDVVMRLQEQDAISNEVAEECYAMLNTPGVRPVVVLSWLYERVSPSLRKHELFRFVPPPMTYTNVNYRYDKPVIIPPPQPPQPPDDTDTDTKKVYTFIADDGFVLTQIGNEPGDLVNGGLVQVLPDGNFYPLRPEDIPEPGAYPAILDTDGGLHPIGQTVTYDSNPDDDNPPVDDIDDSVTYDSNPDDSTQAVDDSMTYDGNPDDYTQAVDDADLLYYDDTESGLLQFVTYNDALSDYRRRKY